MSYFWRRHINQAICIYSKSTMCYWWIVDYASGRRVKYVNRTPKSVAEMLFTVNALEIAKNGFKPGVWYHG